MASPGDWMMFLVLHGFVSLFLWMFVVRPINALSQWKPPEFTEDMLSKEKKKIDPDDFWDEGALDYDTGAIDSNPRPSIRSPKNADRAYSGSVERFHDGGR